MKTVRKSLACLSESDISAWECLTASEEALRSPFYQYDFARAISHAGVRVEVVIGYEEDAVLFILPLQFKSEVNRKLGFAQKLGGQLSDYSGLIISKKHVEMLTAKDILIDYLILDHVPLQSTLSKSTKDYRFQSETSQIVLSGGFNDYIVKLTCENKRLMTALVQEERELEQKLGKITFTFKSQVSDDLALFFKQHKQYCDEKSIHDPFSNKGFKNVLTQLNQLKHSKVTPILSTLFAGDTWLATHFGIESDGVIHYWFHIENTLVASPLLAQQLLIKVIKTSFEKNYKHIDLGFGHVNSDNKNDAKSFYSFVNRRIPLYKEIWVRSSVKGALCNLVQSLKWRLGLN